MSQNVQEKIALVASVLIIAAALWFWAEQIGNVRETLQLLDG